MNVKGYKRRYYLANKEKILRKCREYNATHIEERKLRVLKYYESNRSVMINRACQWIADNRDRYNAARRLRYKSNPYKRLNEKHGRRSKENATNCTSKISLLGLERFCRWCCIKLTDAGPLRMSSDRAIDHIVPLSRSGLHIPDNLAAACRRCNCSRQNKLVDEWLPYATLPQTL